MAGILVPGAGSSAVLDKLSEMIKINQVLMTGILVPGTGSSAVLDKLFQILGKAREEGLHTSNTPFRTGNFPMFKAQSRRCLISANV